VLGQKREFVDICGESSHIVYLLLSFLLGAFEKLHKGIISFVMSVRPTICPSSWNTFGSQWTDFHEI
jgi:hypothetical protein